MRQDTGTGTLYSEDPNIQPIVPLADVIKVGVVVKWDSSGCEMKYRSGEKLPVFLQDGCPMLPMQRGMELLYEVEEFNRRKLKLRRAVTHPQPDRDREEEFMSRLARIFPEVPLRILERVPGKVNYDNDIMGINRRTRRQVERAETVVLNLFSGPNTKIWTSHGQKGLLILNVEVLKGTDLLESNFYGYLEAQARFGRFSAIYRWPTMQNSELLQIWPWPRWRTTTFEGEGRDPEIRSPRDKPWTTRGGGHRLHSMDQDTVADSPCSWIKEWLSLHGWATERSKGMERGWLCTPWRSWISKLSVLAGDWPDLGSLWWCHWSPSGSRSFGAQKEEANNMSSMKWSSQGFQRWLRKSPEPHLWEVCQQDVVTEESQPLVICHVAVYVDDLMVTGKREDARDVMEQLAKTFQMTSPEEVSETQEVTFCGYQIQKTKTGFALHQQKYVQEVLQKHGIQCSESVPCLKISDGPEEQDPAREDIKQAQIVTGELGWLTSRTRPDIAFSVSIMARMIHKRPKWVKETGMQVLKYLHGSKSWGLNYTRIDDPTVLNVLVDASYAPPHEGYRSVQGAIYMHGTNVLMWSSSRQSFITQSTAEAELLAYNESAQGAESVAHLLECFDQKVARRLMGDSKSGLVQLTGEVGSWRTRHLRLRSAKLRELIQHGVDGWHAVHRDGKDLAADGMTKPLAGQAFVKFRSMLYMKDCSFQNAEENTQDTTALRKCAQESSGASLRDLGCGLLGAGSALLATGNKKLALALVASGVALCWKEGGKRPASKAIEQNPTTAHKMKVGRAKRF